MKNYIYLDGKKIPISEETANNLRGKPRAKKGDMYYYINFYLKVVEDYEVGYSGDNECYKSGNYFLKESDAEKVAEKFKKILKES